MRSYFLKIPRRVLLICRFSLAHICEVLQTQSSPLAQRVQFLEAKGLTSPEIEEAMRQASATQPVSYNTPQYGTYQSPYGPVTYTTAQPPHIWDWRDYFVSEHAARRYTPVKTPQITAVVSGTVVYGAVALFKVNLPLVDPSHAKLIDI